MIAIVSFVVTTPPPLMVPIVFLVAYLAIGVPAHLFQGPVARDIFGTMAGVFASLFYLTLIIGFQSDLQGGFR
jgi:hypothetical protein